MKRSRKEYNQIVNSFIKSHATQDSMIKTSKLQEAIEVACKYYNIPKKDFVDVWLDFYENYRKVQR